MMANSSVQFFFKHISLPRLALAVLCATLLTVPLEQWQQAYTGIALPDHDGYWWLYRNPFHIRRLRELVWTVIFCASAFSVIRQNLLADCSLCYLHAIYLEHHSLPGIVFFLLYCLLALFLPLYQEARERLGKTTGTAYKGRLSVWLTRCGFLCLFLALPCSTGVDFGNSAVYGHLTTYDFSSLELAYSNPSLETLALVYSMLWLALGTIVLRFGKIAFAVVALPYLLLQLFFIGSDIDEACSWSPFIRESFFFLLACFVRLPSFKQQQEVKA